MERGQDSDPLVLITGATGYVGSRLLAELERQGLRLRVLARRPQKLADRVGPRTEVLRGDLLEPGSLPGALAGVDAAYYLVHSMQDHGDYAEKDRRAATHFADAARRAGVGRVIYLGGLGRDADLSEHLRSRQEVGRILRESGVDCIEFRASVVIGAGSLSYEMVRALVERLPLMVIPRWVRTAAQPIAVDDLLGYLIAARSLPLEGSRIYEIGGADRVSYLDLMQEYARQRGLKRAFVRVPVLSPRISALWLSLFTPLLARVGRNLIAGVKNATVVHDPAALRDFPIRPMNMTEAVRRAMEAAAVGSDSD